MPYNWVDCIIVIRLIFIAPLVTNIMKLSAKYRPNLFVTVMAALMSIVMSFALTAINIGFPSNFLTIWLRACLIAFIVAVPAAIAARPIANRVVDALIE